MNTETIDTPMEVPGWAPEQESIHWTRQADGTYVRQGSLPAGIPTARIFSIDEDFQTNPHAVCPGLKVWPREEAIGLVERKIAEGSYQGWRYEIRPEMPSAETPPALSVARSESSAFRLCLNQRCKKGPNGTREIVKSQRAKYCSPSCRVAVSRREGKPVPKCIEGRKRKQRNDAKHQSNAQRQGAYRARLQETRRAGIKLPLPSSVTDNRLLQPL
jgi:hypothetical protein